MPARIVCPHCQSHLRLPEDLYEGPAQCPHCDGAFAIRWQPRGERKRSRPVPADPADAGGRRPCRFCGELIKPQAVKCPFCGEWLEEK
jgi:hypothetical protein